MARCARSPRATVHPRACGEFGYAGGGGRGKGDSSPRMRGILARQRVKPCTDRFIPAHAGNSQALEAAASDTSVHPRACGEFVLVTADPRAASGSSPRMRGIRREYDLTETVSRFIPAHAGNSGARAGCAVWSAVHPRACGEFGIAAKPVQSGGGSSPRMRGIPAHRCRDRLPPRFIPAHAGNSSPPTAPHESAAVHPRACGEFSAWGSESVSADGSSPRMRGIQVSDA